MENEKKVLLENELWQLEVVLESPEFLSKEELKREINRVKEIKSLLKKG